MICWHADRKIWIPEDVEDYGTGNYNTREIQPAKYSRASSPKESKLAEGETERMITLSKSVWTFVLQIMRLKTDSKGGYIAIFLCETAKEDPEAITQNAWCSCGRHPKDFLWLFVIVEKEEDDEYRREITESLKDSKIHIDRA